MKLLSFIIVGSIALTLSCSPKKPVVVEKVSPSDSVTTIDSVTNLDSLPKIEGHQEFDEIVLSTSGCFGTCDIFNVLIRSTGEVFYHGEEYVDHKGYYTGRISEDQYA